MTPEEYRRRQDEVRAPVVLLAAEIVGQIRDNGGIVTPKARDRILELLFRAILGARRKAAVVALEMHKDQSPSGYSPDIREPHYEPAAVDDLLSRTVDQIDPDSVSWPVVEREVTDGVARHVDMAARDATVAAVHADSEAIGFARVLQGETNCAFCLLLASRGPVYGSRYLAGDPDIRRFHDGCDCIVVSVFNEKDWLGRGAWKDAKAIYDKYGKGEDDPLNGIRRHLEGRERKESAGARKGEAKSGSDDQAKKRAQKMLDVGEAKLRELEARSAAGEDVSAQLDYWRGYIRKLRARAA